MTPAALRALLCLSEIVGRRLGGMAGLVRNDLFPSAEEISALAMQFAILPGENGIEDPSKGALPDSHVSTPPYTHTPIPPPCEGEVGKRRKVKIKMPLDMINNDYEQLRDDRKRLSPVDYINRNIVSRLLHQTLLHVKLPTFFHVDPHTHTE